MTRPRVALLACLSIPLGAQTDLPRDVILLARIRHRAAEDLAHIPNFTCLETIERSSRTSDAKRFEVKDVVRVEVAHVGDHELFAWPGASRFESGSLTAMVGSGMISSGEFVSHAQSVFLGNSAVIRYAGEDEFARRRAAHYEYEISPLFSGYTIVANGQSAVTGVRGSFWADIQTYDLLWLGAAGMDIPPQLGILRTQSETEYSRVRIGSRDVLLPQSASTEMLSDTGVESFNRIEFTHCRQYTSESVLSFTEDPSALAASGAHTPAISEFAVPANLVCSLRLDSTVPLKKARIGDPISAVVASDVREKKKIVIPKGAVVAGRLRLILNDAEGYLVGLEFTDISFPGNHARFLAELVAVDPTFARMKRTSEHGKFMADAIESRTVTEIPPALAGVGTFFTAPGVTELPKGMSLEWKTLTLGK